MATSMSRPRRSVRSPGCRGGDKIEPWCRRSRAGEGREEIAGVDTGVADSPEHSELRLQRRVLLCQGRILVGLHRIPGMQVMHLIDARLEHLFEAAETRLDG